MTKYNESEQFIASLVADHPDDCARMVEALEEYGITRTVEQVAAAWNEVSKKDFGCAWGEVYIYGPGSSDWYESLLMSVELDWADGEVARLTAELEAVRQRIEQLERKLQSAQTPNTFYEFGLRTTSGG